MSREHWCLVGASLLATLGVNAPASAAPATLDPQIQAITEQARSAFLATQSFKRLNLALWVQAAPGQPWRGGEVDAAEQVYPASMVKLPFAIDSVATCVEHGAAPDCQHDDLVPMLVDSDNVATGRLVDGLTGTIDHHEGPIAPGVQAVAAPADEATRNTLYAKWLAARLHTEKRLQSWGMLGGMRLFSKTYPTNSGEEPAGFEKRARQDMGRNTMSAHDIAALMRALVDGDIDTRSGAPVLTTLRPYLARTRFSLQSTLASGAPPDTRIIGKMGTAYNTLEEVALLDWPDSPQKPRVLIAAFSDGYDQAPPEPFDGWRLAGLTTEILTRLKIMPAPPWQASQAQRKGLALWQLPAANTARTIEVQYRFAQYGLATGQLGIRRVQLRCAPGCSTSSVVWNWPAAQVAARPLLLGTVNVPAGAKLEVEAELESATATPGEVLWLTLPSPATTTAPTATASVPR